MKFPNGELWEQFEPKVRKQCSPVSEIKIFGDKKIGKIREFSVF
jgi:hypothetical protein